MPDLLTPSIGTFRLVLPGELADAFAGLAEVAGLRDATAEPLFKGDCVWAFVRGGRVVFGTDPATLEPAAVDEGLVCPFFVRFVLLDAVGLRTDDA